MEKNFPPKTFWKVPTKTFPIFGKYMEKYSKNRKKSPPAALKTVKNRRKGLSYIGWELSIPPQNPWKVLKLSRKFPPHVLISLLLIYIFVVVY